EAEYFADAGITDMIHAVGLAPHKLARLGALAARGIDIMVVLDTRLQALAMANAARSGRPMPAALIEIDCDGHRGGVLPDDPRLVEIAEVLREGGVELRGVLTHAGESYACRGGEGLSEAAVAERAAPLRAAERLR